jgi:uncharacterized protein
MRSYSGEVVTNDGARVMRRLCKHWSHKFTVQCDDIDGVIQLNDVRVTMRATPDRLHVQLVNPLAEVPERLKGVVAEHLQRMAGDQPFMVEWAEAVQ